MPPPPPPPPPPPSSSPPKVVRRRQPSTSKLATTAPLKRHAKSAQGYIQACLKDEEFTIDKWSVLYNAHVRLIAMGEVFCHTRRPLCGDCPLNKMCQFAIEYPEYLQPPKVEISNSITSLSSTLSVFIVEGTVAVTLGGVRRPVSPFSVHDEDVHEKDGDTRTTRISSNNYVQCVLHATTEFEDYYEGRLFISPWLAFRGSFPMRGSYFLQNEMFEVEGVCRAPRSSLCSSGETRVMHLTRSMPSIFRTRPRSEVSRIFRSGFVCCRRFRFPRQLRSYGRHFQGGSSSLSSSSSSFSAPPMSAEDMAKRDISEALYRMVHILENKQREEDWKSGKKRRPKSQRKISKKGKKGKKSSSSSSSSPSPSSSSSPSKVSGTQNLVLALVTDIQNKRMETRASPEAVRQKTLDVVIQIQSRRQTALYCLHLVTTLVTQVLDGCHGALVCTCFAIDDIDAYFVRCDCCMRQHHLPCTNLDDEDCAAVLNMSNNVHASFVCRECSSARIPTISLVGHFGDFGGGGGGDGGGGRKDDDASSALAARDSSRPTKNTASQKGEVVDTNENDRLCNVQWWILKAKGMKLSRWIRTSSLMSTVSSTVRAGKSCDVNFLERMIHRNRTIVRELEMKLNRYFFLQWSNEPIIGGGSINVGLMTRAVGEGEEEEDDDDDDATVVVIDDDDEEEESDKERKERKESEKLLAEDRDRTTGKYALAYFLQQVAETMLLVAEEDRDEAIQQKKENKKLLVKRRREREKNKGSSNARGGGGGGNGGNGGNGGYNGGYHETDSLVVEIDASVLHEMYTDLVAKHIDSGKTMEDIHHALEMSEWDENRADACLSRRSTLRRSHQKSRREEAATSFSSFSSSVSSSSSSAATSSSPSFQKNTSIVADLRSSETVVVNEWQCRDCTFMNHFAYVECSLCECPSTILPPPIEFVLPYVEHALDHERESSSSSSSSSISSRKNRKKRRKKKSGGAADESLCFVCKDGGRLIKCDFHKCKKVYHHVCAGLEDSETMKKKVWYCSHHYCCECGDCGKQWEIATQACYLCPCASKCKDHEKWRPLAKFVLPTANGCKGVEKDVCKMCADRVELAMSFREELEE